MGSVIEAYSTTCLIFPFITENMDTIWNKVNKRSLFSFLIIMNVLIQLIAAVSLTTIGVLVVLLAIYARIYSNTRASFTLGLIFFAALIMLQNIIAVYAYFAMEELYSSHLLPYFVAIHIAELAGIASLLKVTL